MHNVWRWAPVHDAQRLGLFEMKGYSNPNPNPKPNLCMTPNAHSTSSRLSSNTGPSVAAAPRCRPPPAPALSSRLPSGSISKASKASRSLPCDGCEVIGPSPSPDRLSLARVSAVRSALG